MFRAGRRGLGKRTGECLPTRKPLAVGLASSGEVERSSGSLSLVHALIAPRYAHQACAIHQAGGGGMRLRQRTVPSPATVARRRGTRTRLETDPHRHRHAPGEPRPQGWRVTSRKRQRRALYGEPPTRAAGDEPEASATGPPGDEPEASATGPPPTALAGGVRRGMT